jgi:hypothetical protein
MSFPSIRRSAMVPMALSPAPRASAGDQEQARAHRARTRPRPSPPAGGHQSACRPFDTHRTFRPRGCRAQGGDEDGAAAIGLPDLGRTSVGGGGCDCRRIGEHEQTARLGRRHGRDQGERRGNASVGPRVAPAPGPAAFLGMPRLPSPGSHLVVALPTTKNATMTARPERPSPAVTAPWGPRNGRRGQGARRRASRAGAQPQPQEQTLRHRDRGPAAGLDQDEQRQHERPEGTVRLSSSSGDRLHGRRSPPGVP